MSLTAKPGKVTPPIKGGTYQAVCYSVIDLGTQYNEIFHKFSPKVVITWEIPSLRIEYEKDGEQLEGVRVISKTYTNILHEKSNLYQDLVNWRGKSFTPEELKGFDVSQILGANCVLTIVNTEKNGKTYANVGGVSKPMEGMPSLTPENETVKYDIDDGSEAIPTSVPDWIKDIIKKCREFARGGQPNLDYCGEGGTGEPSPTDDDIPF